MKCTECGHDKWVEASLGEFCGVCYDRIRKRWLLKRIDRLFGTVGSLAEKLGMSVEDVNLALDNHESMEDVRESIVKTLNDIENKETP